jgi:ATP-dependent DNA ligase
MIDTDGNEWACQLKVDGYRALVHIKERETGQEVKVFSRRMNNITESLPELQEVDWPSGSYILDGEIISENGSYSETSARIGRKSENVERDVAMQFAVFDAIIYAGENIWSNQYRTRYSRLQSLDLNTGDTIQLLPLESDYDAAKKRALSNDEEGLILKRMDAPYEFGKRSRSWVKHKFDAENCDLKIAGLEEGEGKASGTLGKVELETSDGVFVGYSGSGFTDAERDAIWNNQDEWLGRCVEIEARGLGSESKLRMPIYKLDRSADGEPDSWERVQEVMDDV